MLHQANIARSSYSGDDSTSSLAADYLNSVATVLASITTLPVKSHGTKQVSDM